MKFLEYIACVIIGLFILDDITYNYLIEKKLKFRAFIFFPIKYIINKGNKKISRETKGHI